MPGLPDDLFLPNLVEARENGYDLVCAECGCGIFDDSDFHDRYCSQYESPVVTSGPKVDE